MTLSDALIGGGNTKAPNLSVLIFLIFSILWLVLGTLSITGLALDSSVAASHVISGVLAAIAVMLLASRVQIAVIGATVIGILIFITPFVFNGLSLSMAQSRQENEMVDMYAAKIARPLSERDFEGFQMADKMKAKGYEEPPEVVKLAAEREEYVKNWLRDNVGKVLVLEQGVEKRRTREKYSSLQEFQKDRLAYLLSPGTYTGANWIWFGLWLSDAKAIGFKDADKLSPEDTESAVAHARDWLSAHPEIIKSQIGMPEGADEERQVRSVQTYGSASITIWILLFAVGAAWAGRNSFYRPWEVGNFPGWAMEGMRRLVRRDRFAWLRIVGGLIAMGILGVVIGLLVSAGIRSKPLGKLIAGLMTLSGLLVCSGLSFGEDEGAAASK